MGAIVLDASKVNSYVLPNLVKSKNTMQDAYSTSQSLRSSLPSSFTYRSTINDIVNQLYNIKREISDIDTMISKKVEKAKTIESRNDNRASGIAKTASSIGSVVGTIGGAAIGTATGGVVGTVAGAYVGSKVGSAVGKGLANTGAKIWNGFTSFCSNIWDGAKELGKKIYEGCKKIVKKATAFVKEKVFPVIKNIGAAILKGIKWLGRLGASIVNVGVSIVEGLVSFIEALVDAVVLIVGGVFGSLGGMVVDLVQGLTGKGWDWSATGAVWKKGLLPFVGTNYTDKLIFQHYDGTFFDKYAFDWAKRDGGIVYEIGKGVGYYVGVIVASVFTAGAAGAAGGVAGGFVSTFANGIVAGTAELGKATQSNYNSVIDNETKNYYINETMKAYPGLTLEEATQFVKYNLENSLYENYDTVRKNQQDNISTGNVVKVMAASGGQAVVEGVVISLLRDTALKESISKYGKVAKAAGIVQDTGIKLTEKITIGGIGKAGAQFVKSYAKEGATVIVDGDYNFKNATIDGTSAAITEVLNANIGLKNIKSALTKTFKGKNSSNVPIADSSAPNQSQSSQFIGGVSEETAEEASEAIKKKVITKLWEMTKSGAKGVKDKHIITKVLPERMVKDSYKTVTKKGVISPVVSNIVS